VVNSGTVRATGTSSVGVVFADTASLNNAVGMDYSHTKLRFLRRYGMPLVRASAFALPLSESHWSVSSSRRCFANRPRIG